MVMLLTDLLGLGNSSEVTGGQRNEICISKCYKDHCYFYLILQLIVGATWVFLLLVNCLLTLLIFSFFLAFVCLWQRSGCYWGISQSRENSTRWVNTAQNKVLIPFSLCIWITLRVHIFWCFIFNFQLSLLLSNVLDQAMNPVALIIQVNFVFIIISLLNNQFLFLHFIWFSVLYSYLYFISCWDSRTELYLFILQCKAHFSKSSGK